jgi:hypothetical protein
LAVNIKNIDYFALKNLPICDQLDMQEFYSSGYKKILEGGRGKKERGSQRKEKREVSKWANMGMFAAQRYQNRVVEFGLVVSMILY